MSFNDRTVTEEYEETVFEVEPEKVRVLLTRLVGEVRPLTLHASMLLALPAWQEMYDHATRL